MPKKRHSTEEIIDKLRELEVLVAQGIAWRSDPVDRGDGQGQGHYAASA